MLRGLSALLVLYTSIHAHADVPAHGPADAQVSVCFVPEQSCTGAIVAAIDAARTELRVQAYGFTSPAILRALAAARRRGVDVAVILDRSNLRARYTGATYVAHVGIPVWIDTVPGIAHSKVMIIDRTLVIGGSFNFTLSADRRNVENVTFSYSPQVADWFLNAWKQRQHHAVPFGSIDPEN